MPIDDLPTTEAYRAVALPPNPTTAPLLELELDHLKSLPLRTEIRTTEWVLGKTVEAVYTLHRAGPKFADIGRNQGWQHPVRMPWEQVEWFFLKANDAQRKIIGIVPPNGVSFESVKKVTGARRTKGRIDTSLTILKADLGRAMRLMHERRLKTQAELFTYLLNRDEALSAIESQKAL